MSTKPAIQNISPSFLRTAMPGKIILKEKRERSLLRFHPWIFSGAVNTIEGKPETGETVDVFDCNGHWLAKTAYSPQSNIICRVWTFTEGENVDQLFFHRRLEAAANYRDFLRLKKETNAYRLVHGEADGLPGLVIDRYGDFFIIQCSTAATDRWKMVIAKLLMKFPGTRGVYERSDVDSRVHEGLSKVSGLLMGEEPPEFFEVVENDMHILADLKNGHKTGYYLDQRENRKSLGCDMAGRSVLNCFCYSGGFGIRAAMEGAASVMQVDAAEPALALAKKNARQNSLPEERFTYIKADVFQMLRTFRDSRKSFDVIVLDPPKFAETQAQLEKACRGYKDINLLGFKLLKPGGTLLTFSCSAAMTPELFRKVIGDAQRDSKRTAHVVRTLEQSSDHPRSLNFPEGDYLTGLELHVE